MDLFLDFEINKVVSLGKIRGFDLIKRCDLTLPTFDVFDEFMDGQKVATIQWTGESWACGGNRNAQSSTSALGALLNECNSPYFWEYV